MLNCRNKLPRTCEAWIRIHESSVLARDESRAVGVGRNVKIKVTI